MPVTGDNILHSLFKLLFLTSLLTGASTLTHAQSDDGAPRLDHTMSIVGQGEHWVSPEVAEFSGEVITRGDTLAAARDGHPAIAAKVRSVIDGLAAQGLKLDSARYSIRETYPFQFDNSPNLTAADKAKAVYEATTSFALSTENLTGIADVISALGSGDLRIRNIHFTVKNERISLLEARKDAARDALDQANAYAEALGVFLVGIRGVTDGDASPPSGEYADLAILTGPDGRVPLSVVVPNQLRYGARVTIDWTIGSAPPKP